ncbi:MAG: hypothetical protein U0795_16245 [Pirellulales bacterium]
MNQVNPYDAPAGGEPCAEPVDPRLLHQMATRLIAARRRPPTVWRTLLQWRGTPAMILLGVVGTSLIHGAARASGDPMMTYVTVGFGAAIFGAALRDLGITRHAVRYWPAQSQFIDWKKVDDYAK